MHQLKSSTLHIYPRQSRTFDCFISICFIKQIFLFNFEHYLLSEGKHFFSGLTTKMISIWNTTVKVTIYLLFINPIISQADKVEKGWAGPRDLHRRHQHQGGEDAGEGMDWYTGGGFMYPSVICAMLSLSVWYNSYLLLSTACLSHKYILFLIFCDEINIYMYVHIPNLNISVKYAIT